MSTPNIQTRLKCVHEMIEGTERLNELLHNAEFAFNKMNKILVVFPSPSLHLALSQLSICLMEDENLKLIVDDEIDKNLSKNEALYPFFLLYCSIIVYVEYIKSQTNKIMEEKNNNVE